MSFRLGKGSLSRLEGVHPDLVALAKLAIRLSPVDFSIVEGLRSIETQRDYVARGASKTMNSRHLTGDAYDFCPYIGGKLVWTDLPAIKSIIVAHQEAADQLGQLIVSGADWDNDGVWVDDDDDESFMDGYHIQRPWPYQVRAAKTAQARRTTLRHVEPTRDEVIAMLDSRVQALEEQVRRMVPRS